MTREDVGWTDWLAGEPNDGNGVENGAQNNAYIRFGPGATYAYWIDHPGGESLDCMIVEWE